MTREEGRIREAGKQVGKKDRLRVVSDQGREQNQGSRETSREEGQVESSK